MEENMELALLLVNFMKKMVTTVRHPAVEDKEMKLTSHAFNALWILGRPGQSGDDDGTGRADGHFQPAADEADQ